MLNIYIYLSTYLNLPPYRNPGVYVVVNYRRESGRPNVERKGVSVKEGKTLEPKKTNVEVTSIPSHRL